MTCYPGDSKGRSASSHSTLRKGWSKDVSEDIASEVLNRTCDAGHSSCTREFTILHVGEKRKPCWRKMQLCKGSCYAAASRDGKVFSRIKATTLHQFSRWRLAASASSANSRHFFAMATNRACLCGSGTVSASCIQSAAYSRYASDVVMADLRFIGKLFSEATVRGENYFLGVWELGSACAFLIKTVLL